MKKRTILGIGLLGATLLGSMGQPTMAVDNISDITLQADPNGGGPDVPTKPTDPDGETGETGALRMVNITPFQFGTNNLSGKTESYALDATKYANEDPNIEVVDARGTGEGWEVKVSATKFLDGATELKGAELILPAGAVSATDSDNKSTAPTPSAVTVSETEQGIFSASAGTDSGMGGWINSLPKADVKLKVPSGNKVGAYKATLTWTLSTTPAP